MRRNKEKPPRPAGTAPDGAVPEAERQLARWAREAEELLEAYPELDLQSECESDLFRHLLRGKLPMREAYEMAHAGELREAAVGPFTVGFDPLRLGRKERKEIVRRMLAGDPDPFRRGKE